MFQYRTFARYLLLLAFSFIFAPVANASQYIVWGTTLSLYTQSPAESNAHLIRLTKPMLNGAKHPWCVDRAYINLTDSAMYASALSASLLSKNVNVIYDDAAPAKSASGHALNFTCKVISIF